MRDYLEDYDERIYRKPCQRPCCQESKPNHRVCGWCCDPCNKPKPKPKPRPEKLNCRCFCEPWVLKNNNAHDKENLYNRETFETEEEFEEELE